MKTSRLTPLILLIGSFLSLCSTELLGQNRLSRAQNIKNLTLTGQTEATAKDQILSFAAHKDEDNRPEIVSVWFDINTIRRMVDLIKSETDLPGNFIPDGIRIYYTGDSNSMPYLKASIVLVSTKTDKHIQYPDQSEHRDYYEHDSTNVLFKTRADSLKGLLSNDDCNGGAKLYYRSGKKGICGDSGNSNAVPIDSAEDMVIRNKNHKHKINTTAEWLGLKVFESYLQDSTNDGVRIYFARRRGVWGLLTTGRNSFLLINTKPRQNNKDIHDDDLDCSSSMLYFNRNMYFNKETHKEVANLWKANDTTPQDNGQLCPYNCN